MVSYERFWATMKQKGVTAYALRNKHNISPGILTRMRRNEYLNLKTINDLCNILGCRIEDIVEHIPEDRKP